MFDRSRSGFGLLVVLLSVAIIAILISISEPMYSSKLHSSVYSLDKSQIDLAEKLALTDVNTSGWMDTHSSSKKQVYFYVLDSNAVTNLCHSTADIVASTLYGPVPAGVYHGATNTSSTTMLLMNSNIYARSVDITTGQIATLKKAVKLSAHNNDDNFCVVEVWVKQDSSGVIDSYVWPNFDSQGNVVEYKSH